MTHNASIDEGLSSGKENAAEAMKDRASKALEDGMEVVQQTAQQATEQAGDELRKLTQTGTKFVRENPGAAIAGAVGIGVLLGLALRSRD